MAEDDTTEIEMRDGDAVEEERMMYGHGALTEQELDEKFPNRPHNHSKTLPFHELHLTLFNPLNENKKKPTGPVATRRQAGPHGPGHSPNDVRKLIIDRFVDRWRKQVGNDIYPAFRLIVPENDRDRAMYGLKEMTLAKLLVRVMKIDKNSEDAYNLLHWKLPGAKSSTAMAGDFAGRCFEVINKRAMRRDPGDMTIAQVNELLDRLSVAQKEENQRPIIEEFYNRMNAEELMWLIRMILRHMKIGATQKTMFERWHPDAENLFNISSSLRRVCWELSDPEVRLEGDDRGIHLMECFQPQLAAFQMRSMDSMIARMKTTEDDSKFWIEEKLDGERMQLHMTEDDDHPGGFRFGFWSRKAKDYTYLYGNGFEDDSSLTRNLKSAFNEGVRSIILDGEMITWDPKADVVVGFGHLKTAAIAEQQNLYADGNRPLFRVFDCLLLNGVDLTRYTLRKRREALEKSITNVYRRLEVHEYTEAQEAGDIEPRLRQVIATSGEGLVLKNPRSMYCLADRNDDWIKVKPEYMTEYGEALDCIVIGGYYGSGKRGGGLSSFLCGLRVDDVQVQQGANPQKCLSFFKVGGGFSVEDYQQVWHRTDGKWNDWDRKKPPVEWVALGGDDRQYERPDVWIKPEDSVVLEVKAANVWTTDQFKVGWTLRFPRFKRLRTDKNWKTALSLREFRDLKEQVEEEQKEKQIKIDETRRNKRSTRKRKREMLIQGQDDVAVATPYAGPATKAFDGLSIYVMTEALKPLKKSKAELEQLVKANGGTVVTSEKDPDTIVIADRNLVKVASLQKKDQRNLVRPQWLVDCVKQSEIDVGRPSLLLPFEPHHLFFTTTAEVGHFDDNVDEFGDSYAKDVSTEKLLALFNRMPSKVEEGYDPPGIARQLLEHEHDLDVMPGWMFNGVEAYCVDVAPEVVRLLLFAGGTVVDPVEEGPTHVITTAGNSHLHLLRKDISTLQRIPRLVTTAWLTDSWRASTRLDEERMFRWKSGLGRSC